MVLKTLHFLGLIFWTGGLAIFVSNLTKLHSTQNKDAEYNKLRQSNQDLYRKRINPLMMFTWIAGLGLIYYHGMEWFKLNLWLHQKILLLLFLTVYQVFARLVMYRSTDSFGIVRFSQNFLHLFNFFFYFLVTAIVIIAVFKPTSVLFMGIVVLIGLSGILYLSYQIFRHKHSTP